MTTAPKSRRKISCPDGWLNAGAKVPVHLTVRQEEYCRRAIDVHQFCYNLAVRTHRFCRRNRLSWPSWQDISKAFNACKREDYPFVTQVEPLLPLAPSGTSARPWTTGGTPTSGPGCHDSIAGRSPAPAHSWRPAA